MEKKNNYIPIGDISNGTININTNNTSIPISDLSNEIISIETNNYPNSKSDLSNETINIGNGQIIYDMYITSSSYNNSELKLFSKSEPKTNDNIHLLLSLNIDKFNSSNDSWKREKIEIKTLEKQIDNNHKELFIANLDNYNLNDSILTLTKIKTEPSNKNDLYYIHFSNIIFTIPNENEDDDSRTTSYLKIISSTEVIDNIVIKSSKTSKSLSKGAIIGIISGIIVPIWYPKIFGVKINPLFIVKSDSVWVIVV